MTWQRIDENSYIDDTLVTCAEYQLFIDEMREQGKYHQPDHWTSFQFPKGQAKEPILGVRYSDAVAFCEWLTGRENGEWIYRLTGQAETVQFPIKVLWKRGIGFWIIGEYQFSWIDAVPEDARRIDFNLAFAPVRDNALGRLRNLEVKQDLTSLALDREFKRLLNRDHTNAIKYVNAYIRTIELVRTRIAGFNKSLPFDLIHTINLAVVLYHDLGHYRGLSLGLALDPTIDRNPTHAHDHKRALDRARDKALEHACDFVSKNASNHEIDQDLVVYFDLLTLQERTAGRSPAFEGIRLVKERIK